MAKVCWKNRNLRRKNLSESRKAKRIELREQVKNPSGDQQDAIDRLSKCKRDESPCRIRNRCNSCGRPHGTLKRFGLCRLCLRKAVNRGDVPGLRKASW